jgi:hypothetical protein
MGAVMVVVATGCYRAYDLTGDGQADRVWLTTDGNWYRDTSTSGAGTTEWTATPVVLAPEPVPLAGAVPVVGDYDGDGRDDLAVVSRPPSTSAWFTAPRDGAWSADWATHSTVGTISFAPPPASTNAIIYPTVPVPGRWNGGATTVPAWYRDVDGTWFVQGHDPVVFGHGPTTVATGAWYEHGVSGYDQDMPVPADYDGDGTTDLAVYSPLTGVWRARGSATGAELTTTLGGPGWFPVPGDYDGVHHSQFAVFDALATGSDPIGTWKVDGGRTGATPAAHTNAGNLPVPADYDGDGRLDFATVTDFEGLHPQPVWHLAATDRAGGASVSLPPAPTLPAETAPWLLVELPRLTMLAGDVCEPAPPYYVIC